MITTLHKLTASLCIFVSVVVFSLLLFVSHNLQATKTHPESYYQNKDCSGSTEVILEDNTRPDCVTPDVVIEYDFASKYKECIGQTLHYARMTHKRGVCVLILKSKEDMKYVIAAKEDLSYHKLNEILITFIEGYKDDNY